jgi:hypothetical protein
MSTPQPEERRLGLLQCPNAASRGWGSNVGITIAALEDHCEGRHDGDEIENGEALSEFAQNASSKVPVEDFGESESIVEEANATDAHVAAANEPTEPGVILESSEPPVEPTQDPQTDKNDEAAAPRKKLRVNEGLARGGKDATKFSSCTDVFATTHEQSQTEPVVHNKEEGEVVTSTVELSKNAGEEPRFNPIHISTEYESTCHCSYCTSLESIPQNEKSRALTNTSCTNEKGQILTITLRYSFSKAETVINVGTISGRAKVELIQVDHTHCAQNQLMKEEDDEIKIDHSDKPCNDLALDVFGYRLSHSCKTKSIEVHRPNWMNALPLSLVCPAVLEEQHFTKELRVRMQSLRNGKEATKDDNCYYSSHPEESYKLTIYPQTEEHKGNAARHASERKSGVTFISDPWKNAADKIANTMQYTNGSMEEKATPSQLPSNCNRILVCGAKGVGK